MTWLKVGVKRLNNCKSKRRSRPTRTRPLRGAREHLRRSVITTFVPCISTRHPKATETGYRIWRLNHAFAILFSFFICIFYLAKQRDRKKARENPARKGKKWGFHRQCRPWAKERGSWETQCRRARRSRTTWSPFSVPSTIASRPLRPPCVPLRLHFYSPLFGSREKEKRTKELHCIRKENDRKAWI